LVNEARVRDLATGTFLAEQCNAVLIGGTGIATSHPATAIARRCIRDGARVSFCRKGNFAFPDATNGASGRC